MKSSEVSSKMPGWLGPIIPDCHRRYDVSARDHLTDLLLWSKRKKVRKPMGTGKQPFHLFEGDKLDSVCPDVMLVDLVGHQEEIVAIGELDDLLNDVFGEHGGGRVPWVDDHESSGHTNYAVDWRLVLNIETSGCVDRDTSSIKQ